MSDELIKKVFIDQSFHESSEVYQFLAKEIKESFSQELLKKLYFREQLANIQIGKQTILPHLESQEIEHSQLLILRLKEPILQWNHDIGEIRLIICLALKANESKAIKKQIKHFMIRLADESYIEKLLQAPKIDIEKDL